MLIRKELNDGQLMDLARNFGKLELPPSQLLGIPMVPAKRTKSHRR